MKTNNSWHYNTNDSWHYISTCGIGRLAYAIIIVTLSFAMATTLQSCDNNDDTFPIYPINRPNAIVTVKPMVATDSFYMQLDDSTQINAINMRQKPYANKEVRAFVNYRLLTQPGGKHHYDVYVNWMDSILTKTMADNLGTADNTLRYGSDPVEILREWTMAQDDYLTIHFRTQWAANGAPHYVNLVPTNEDNPYELTFYHSAGGTKGGYWSDGIVAFNLNKLPNTKKQPVDITLRWTSFGGRRSVVFRYDPQRGTTKIEGLSFAASGHFEKSIK